MPTLAPSAANLDANFQCEAFQEALRSQIQQLEEQHAEEKRAMNDENDKLRAEMAEMGEKIGSQVDELKRQHEALRAQYRELCSILGILPSGSPSTSRGLHQDHHKSGSYNAEEEEKEEEEEEEEEEE